jgi:dipeptidase E
MSSRQKRLRHIVALGGHGFTDTPEDVTLSRYILAQSPADRPLICYLPQACAEDALFIARFYRHFLGLGAQPSDLSLFQPHTADIAAFLLAQDVIYVGGGNTKSMLALWRDWGVDRILRQSWEQGIVLSGVSAGAICWFEQGLTDSIPGRLSPLDCLGFLPGSCSPHYDGEAERRPTYRRLIAAGELAPGYGIEDNVALHFIDTALGRVVASRPCASAYRVERSPEGVSEVELPSVTNIGQTVPASQSIETD